MFPIASRYGIAIVFESICPDSAEDSKFRQCRNSLSPLLSNVLLDDLDKELEYRGHCFARYCDDFVILVGSQRAGERVMESITRYLERRLKLRINPTKSKVVKATEAEFLSFTFTGKRIRWSEKSLNRFRAENPETHWPKLGSIDGISLEEAGRIYSGLDGLFQNNRILQSHTTTGSMDTSADSLLFYQAMAKAENPLQEFNQVRC
ncbi:reverse transcriptase domain-containing protein [Endozoicomonas gorgoniicola]|uniref:Reverse transcriptase domain-containing protein n=1 Tax=Endozoicomonas gorgoniicola TaxID=1234144 RepID=A0ABT3MTN5_9GAMM|nr:reverse transcriptase domain-containing protein [Endozoicomonas gorgoniicola]MCW7552746.1 reverse transcriptase domain-containing protein [Endozoicomonas gorgoniicola]